MFRKLKKRARRTRLLSIKSKQYPSVLGLPPGSIDTIEQVSQTSSDSKLISYSETNCDVVTSDNIKDFDKHLSDDEVHWLNIYQANNETLEWLHEKFDIHRLALEDTLNLKQRPKIENYDGFDYIVMRMASGKTIEHTEQFSMLIKDNIVITIQEDTGDCLDPLRDRLNKAKGRIRNMPSGYLAYCIVDIIVDTYFPILEGIAENIDLIEDKIFTQSNDGLLNEIHETKNELILVRRVVSGHRGLLAQLLKSPSTIFSEDILLYLRDCYDHTLQQIDLTETYRDVSSNTMDLFLSISSHKANEIMKVLTIIASIFIPLTFITGIYGMNFDTTKSAFAMPELSMVYGYPVILSIMFLIAITMVLFFRKKRWI